jgi:hypothetical protein
MGKCISCMIVLSDRAEIGINSVEILSITLIASSKILLYSSHMWLITCALFGHK